MTNTLFHSTEQVLVAPIKSRNTKHVIARLHIPITMNAKAYYIDLLDLATVFNRSISPKPLADFTNKHYEIKTGLDFLIDGF